MPVLVLGDWGCGESPTGDTNESLSSCFDEKGELVRDPFSLQPIDPPVSIEQVERTAT